MASTDADHDFGENRQLHIIEWEHLDLYKFYPLAMASSWSIRCLLYPMSVVKSRLQLQKQNTVYRGMRHAFIHILRNEGFTALYRVRSTSQFLHDRDSNAVVSLRWSTI
uniref:Solute carrier family 25 member 44 n=1 Tax=Ascaris suum TaxID=6253 RepID=F1LEV4_ASCSU